MHSFEPIAIVGRSCVLPGALTPEALFEAVRHGQVLIGPAPDGAWGLDAKRLLRERSPGPGAEFVISDHGGYVTGFDEVFDAERFADDVEAPERLDPLTQWLLHCASGALEAAVSVLAIDRGVLPPTINLDVPDPDCDLDYTPHVLRRRRPGAVMSNSFGFGGHNASLVFRAYEE